MTEPSSQTGKRIYQGRTWRSMKRNTLAMTGFAIIALLVFFSIFATVLAPFDPAEVHILDRLQAPGAQHWMGTDEFGRDIFSRVLYGARVSLLISSMVVLSAGIVGSLMGLAAGYFLGATDFIVMRIVDGLMAFPALLLSLAIMAALGPNTVNLIIALAIVYVPGFARLTRNAVLSIRELEYVEASRAIGAGHLRIMFDHVLPNCLSPLIVQATVVFGYAILSEAALSFLGFGAPSKASWGAILSDGRDWVFNAPWISIYPGIAISLFVLGANLAGDGLRDSLDPRTE
jgi:peptide/nickel transport system permease protein